ncbi:MAG: succinate dehydrogenase assembly factor 2 [Hyphomicrobiales bacterium]
MNNDNRHADDVRRRKLAYRAAHRGMKEMDVILGGYVARNIDTMSAEELDVLEQIISLPDTDLLNWVTGREKVPDEHKSQLLEAILAYTTKPEDYT